MRARAGTRRAARVIARLQGDGDAILPMRYDESFRKELFR